MNHASPIATSPAALLHRYIDYETGHAIRVDPHTGEVVSRKELASLTTPEAQYQVWAAERRADVSISEDHKKITSAVTDIAQREATGTKAGEVAKKGRGRPRAAYMNPVAAYMHVLVIPNPLPWVDDIIHGSIVTSAGVANGKINVKPRAVVGALFLSDITAEACKSSTYSLRTAQRIAKAARHAAHGIAACVERHPKIKARINEEIREEPLSQGFPN